MSLGERKPPRGAGDRPLVLIADDEEAVRNALGRNLFRLGCDVLLANDGEQALRAALDARPAVLFLDLRMPGLDGHTLLRALPEAGVDASVVVMSGQADMDDVIDALRMGAVDFLKKPWSSSELASALGRGVEVFRVLNDTAESTAGGGVASISERTPGGPRAVWPRLDPTRAKLLDRLQSQEVAVPGVPSTFAHLHRRARDLGASSGAVATSIDETVRLVEGDPALGIAVLRLANSRFHPRDTPTEHLGTAVSHIGARAVHAVAETLALRDGYPIHGQDLRALHDKIWRFSVVRGLAMRAIAEITGPEIVLDLDRCYLAGLLLDAGAVFLLWTLSESRRDPAAAEEAAQDALPPAGVEILATYHAAFSQAVLARWGMGEDLVSLVRHHHECWNGTGFPDSGTIIYDGATGP